MFLFSIQKDLLTCLLDLYSWHSILQGIVRAPPLFADEGLAGRGGQARRVPWESQRPLPTGGRLPGFWDGIELSEHYLLSCRSKQHNTTQHNTKGENKKKAKSRKTVHPLPWRRQRTVLPWLLSETAAALGSWHSAGTEAPGPRGSHGSFLL